MTGRDGSWPATPRSLSVDLSVGLSPAGSASPCSDFAQLFGVDFDGFTVDMLRLLLDQTLKNGHWLILAGQEVTRTGGRQSVLTDTLEYLCRLGTNTGD